MQCIECIESAGNAVIGVIINLTPTATTESHTRFLNEKTALDNRKLVVLRARQMAFGVKSLITSHHNIALVFQTLRFATTHFAIPQTDEN